MAAPISEAPPASLGAELERLGWRQFSFVPKEAQAEVAKACDRSELIDANARLCVASHSCDLVNPNDSAEPSIWLLVFRATSRDSRLRHCKSPRTLHVKAVGPTGVEWFRAEASELIRCERAALRCYSPDAERTIQGDESYYLARWLARRFDRPVFPGAFDNLLASATSAAGERLLKVMIGVMHDLAEHVYEVRIQFDPPGTEHPPFRVRLFALLQRGQDDQVTRKRVEAKLAQIAKNLRLIEGIEVAGEAVAMSHAEMNLELYRTTMDWDPDRMSP